MQPPRVEGFDYNSLLEKLLAAADDPLAPLTARVTAIRALLEEAKEQGPEQRECPRCVARDHLDQWMRAPDQLLATAINIVLVHVRSIAPEKVSEIRAALDAASAPVAIDHDAPRAIEYQKEQESETVIELAPRGVANPWADLDTVCARCLHPLLVHATGLYCDRCDCPKFETRAPGMLHRRVAEGVEVWGRD